MQNTPSDVDKRAWVRRFFLKGTEIDAMEERRIDTMEKVYWKWVTRRGVLHWCLLFCGVILNGSALRGDSDDSITDRYLFKNGEAGYHTFRIPSVIQCENQVLLAFAEARLGHAGDSGDIDLVMKRSEDGGETWSSLQVVWSDGANTCGNPCPIWVKETGEILLWTTWNHGRTHEPSLIRGEENGLGGRRPYLLRSKDLGKSWSSPEEFSHLDQESWFWYATGPGNGIQMQSGSWKGRLVIPANHSVIRQGQPVYLAHVLLSDDLGKSWKLGGTLDVEGSNESTIVELEGGRLVLNTRMQTHRKGFRGVAYSDDGGLTWQDFHHDSSLKCPTCQASLISIGEGSYLFSNPQGGGRSGLTVQMSQDEMKTWERTLLIRASRTFGYSSLVHLGAEAYGILYEGSPDPKSGGLHWRRFQKKDLMPREPNQLTPEPQADP